MHDNGKKNAFNRGLEALKTIVTQTMGWKNKDKIRILFKVNLIRSVDESRRDILQF